MPKQTTPAEPTGPRINLAMAAIMRDIAAIAKDRKNEQQHFHFRGIDDFLNALHPIFEAHGVIVLPCLQDVILPEVVKNAKGNNVYRAIVKMAYTFSATDGSTIEAVCVGEGMDFADKAIYKALSGAMKYLLIQTFLIPTEDIAAADMETTIDPHAELRQMDINKRAEEQEAARQQAILDEKRETLRKQAEADGMPASAKPAAKPAPKGPAATPKTPPAPEPQPEPQKPAPAKRSAKPTPPTPPEPEPEQEFEEPVNEVENEEYPWVAYQISESALKHKGFTGKLLGDLALEDLRKLAQGWADRPDFQDGIAKDPVKKELREMILAALAYREEEAAR